MDQFETDFVSTLTYDLQNIDRNNKGIPREWFEEFYQLAHSCTISGAIKPINAGRPECVPGQKIGVEAINQDVNYWVRLFFSNRKTILQCGYVNMK